MHETVLDQLTRAMRDAVSRRGLLRALAGGGLSLGLLGGTAVPDAAAKNCKKIENKKKRKKCFAKATSPTAQPPPPPSPPVACPSGTFALAGRCAPTCGQPCVDKGGICLDTLEGFLYCAPIISSCASVPKVCSSHANCGAQEFCTTSLCGPNQSVENRCVPFLN